eukprot:4260300-Prorocentrum_lima.AAC.1
MALRRHHHTRVRPASTWKTKQSGPGTRNCRSRRKHWHSNSPLSDAKRGHWRCTSWTSSSTAEMLKYMR